MPKPIYPAPGDEITADWAKQLTDFAGEPWRFVPLPNSRLLNGVAGIATSTLIELTNLPANDPTVVAASVASMIRPTTAATVIGTIQHYDGSECGLNYSPPRAGEGVMAGSFVARVGGINNRQVRWMAGSTASQFFLYCNGYWVRSTPVGSA